jgi:hypothetical protein
MFGSSKENGEGTQASKKKLVCFIVIALFNYITNNLMPATDGFLKIKSEIDDPHRSAE